MIVQEWKWKFPKIRNTFGVVPKIPMYSLREAYSDLSSYNPASHSDSYGDSFREKLSITGLGFPVFPVFMEGYAMDFCVYKTSKSSVSLTIRNKYRPSFRNAHISLGVLKSPLF